MLIIDRIGPPLWMRNSRMCGCLELLTCDDWGLPSAVPRATSRSTTLAASLCSRSVRPFHHASNSSVYSMSQHMASLQAVAAMASNAPPAWRFRIQRPSPPGRPRARRTGRCTASTGPSKRSPDLRIAGYRQREFSDRCAVAVGADATWPPSKGRDLTEVLWIPVHNERNNEGSTVGKLTASTSTTTSDRTPDCGLQPTTSTPSVQRQVKLVFKRYV